MLFIPLPDNKGLHTFTKSICSKVNVIARLEFELAFYNITIRYVNHFTTRTSPQKMQQPNLEIYVEVILTKKIIFNKRTIVLVIILHTSKICLSNILTISLVPRQCFKWLKYIQAITSGKKERKKNEDGKKKERKKIKNEERKKERKKIKKEEKRKKERKKERKREKKMKKERNEERKKRKIREEISFFLSSFFFFFLSFFLSFFLHYLKENKNEVGKKKERKKERK